VRLTGRADHDVAAVDNDGPVADPERGLAGLDDEHLGIRVAMELGPGAGLRMHQDDAEGNVTVLGADELMCVVGVLKVIEGDDRSRRSGLFGQ
jgi:hypothetical protein